MVEEKISEQEQWMKYEREFLMKEAGFLSRSLYRSCWRSVKIMRPGNDYDEEEFARREKEETEGRGSISSPPVDRENELWSRAEYYFAHLREHYNSDFDCLDKNPWKESNIEIFLHYLRTGEQRRKYILNDYKFADPYKSKFPVERVNNFEKRAAELIRVTYKVNNWILPSEYSKIEEEFDPDFDDESGDDEATILYKFLKKK